MEPPTTFLYCQADIARVRLLQPGCWSHGRGTRLNNTWREASRGEVLLGTCLASSFGEENLPLGPEDGELVSEEPGTEGHLLLSSQGGVEDLSRPGQGERVGGVCGEDHEAMGPREEDGEDDDQALMVHLVTGLVLSGVLTLNLRWSRVCEGRIPIDRY